MITMPASAWPGVPAWFIHDRSSDARARRSRVHHEGYVGNCGVPHRVGGPAVNDAFVLYRARPLTDIGGEQIVSD